MYIRTSRDRKRIRHFARPSSVQLGKGTIAPFRDGHGRILIGVILVTSMPSTIDAPGVVGPKSFNRLRRYPPFPLGEIGRLAGERPTSPPEKSSDHAPTCYEKWATWALRQGNLGNFFLKNQSNGKRKCQTQAHEGRHPTYGLLVPCNRSRVCSVRYGMLAANISKICARSKPPGRSTRRQGTSHSRLKSCKKNRQGESELRWRLHNVALL